MRARLYYLSNKKKVISLTCVKVIIDIDRNLVKNEVANIFEVILHDHDYLPYVNKIGYFSYIIPLFNASSIIPLCAFLLLFTNLWPLF